MNTRVALISIIVRESASIEKLNSILHNYSEYVIGRMGIPYKERNMHIISVAVDAPADVINALSGKIGKLSGISSKVAYSDQ